MFGIAFKLLNLARDFVDVGEQAASGFAIETSGGDQSVVTLFALRPGLRIEFSPVVPTLFWRIGSKMNPARARKILAARFGLRGIASGRLLTSCSSTRVLDLLVQLLVSSLIHCALIISVGLWLGFENSDHLYLQLHHLSSTDSLRKRRLLATWLVHSRSMLRTSRK